MVGLENRHDEGPVVMWFQGVVSGVPFRGLWRLFGMPDGSVLGTLAAVLVDRALTVGVMKSLRGGSEGTLRHAQGGSGYGTRLICRSSSDQTSMIGSCTWQATALFFGLTKTIVPLK